MSGAHVEAVGITLLMYAMLGVAYFGWGRAFTVFLVPANRNQEPTPATFLIWIGWAFTLLLFQLIHFAFPINLLSAGPVFALGIVLSVGVLFRRPGRMTSTPAGETPKGRRASMVIVLLAILLPIMAWLASRSMLTADNYDSGLYHFNTIRWINSHPIVKGLGNLHGRLAFNQSFFTYVAALNLYPYFGHGRSIANSFLWLLTLFTMLEMLLPVLKQPVRLAELPPLRWAPALFCLPVLGYWVLASNGINSPSPDLTCCLLQMVIFVMFCRIMGDYAGGARVSPGDCAVLLLLSATAITVKLSTIAFCGVAMALTLVASAKSMGKPVRDCARLLLPAALVLMVWCGRGYLLSGAPLYPSGFGYVKTEWSVTPDQLINERNYVYSWARQPDADWRTVLGNWNWFGPWLRRITGEITEIVYPLSVCLAVGALILVFPLFFARTDQLRPAWLRPFQAIILLPLLAGLAFWFVTAPDPRFASALFMLLVVCAMSLFLALAQGRVKKSAFLMLIGVLLVAGNLNLLRWLYVTRGTLKYVSRDGWQPEKTAPLVERVTKSGLRIYTPMTNDQSWDAPLPCTPYFKDDLRLIDPGNLASGFSVAPLEGLAVTNGLENAP